MTPVFCRVKHDPENGTYGDCLRACVATMLDLQPEAVPHFAHDGAEAEVVTSRLTAWLREQGLAPWITCYDPNETRQNVLDVLHEQSPGPCFMLFGRTVSDGDHVVVCRDGKVEHDPAWYGSPLVKGSVVGAWVVMVFVKL